MFNKKTAMKLFGLMALAGAMMMGVASAADIEPQFFTCTGAWVGGEYYVICDPQ